MSILIFGEFISSINFFALLHNGVNILTASFGLGQYYQGVPIPPVSDIVWGTNAGVRTFPLLLLFGLVQRIFLQFWTYIYLLIDLILPFVIFLLSSKLLKKTDSFSLAGAFFFTANVWVFDRLSTGFWQLNFVYAFLPILVFIPLAIEKNTDFVNTKLKVFFVASIYALTSSIITIAQPHFLVFIGIFIIGHIIYLLFNKKFHVIKTLVYLYSCFIVIYALINVYYFIPGLLFPEITSTAPGQYFSLTNVAINGQSSQLIDVLRFDFLNKFSLNLVNIIELIPIIVILFLALLNKQRRYLYLCLIVVFIFLAKGVNEPFVTISQFIYQNIPIMHIFRDPNRFVAGIALIGSVVIAETQIRLSIKKIPHFKTFFAFIFATIVAIAAFNVILSPVLVYLQQTEVPKQYIDLQSYIQKNIHVGGQDRIMSVPTATSMSNFSWYHNDEKSPNNVLFQSIVPLSIPIADSDFYPDSFSNEFGQYAYETFLTFYNPDNLAALGVKYILVDKSVLYPSNLGQVGLKTYKTLKSKGYKIIFSEGNITLFKIPTQNIVTNVKPIFAIGDYNTISEEYNWGNRPIILLNQSVNNNLISSKNLSGQDFYTDFPNPVLTLASEKLAHSYSVDLFTEASSSKSVFQSFEPYKSQISQYGFALFTSGQSVYGATIKGNMKYPFNLKKGKYEVLLKAATYGTGAVINMKINDVEKQYIVNNDYTLPWEDLGTITLRKNATYVTLGKSDTNFIAIDSLVIVPEVAFAKSQDDVSHVLSSMHVISSLSKPAPPTPKSEFTIANPAKVLSNNPVQYFTYGFSYGTYWKSNATDAVKFLSNGYGMTFVSKSNDISEISYYPNTIYRICVAVSIAAALFCVGIIVYVGCEKFNKKNV
jgi:hypothetical protein